MPALEVRKEVGHHVDEEGHAPCEHFLDGGGTARMGNVAEVEPGFALEKNAREMARRARARGREGDLARARYRKLDEVGRRTDVGVKPSDSLQGRGRWR